jgi:aryl-alcohol dehydrogenase-like predicted oxidoreductase
MNGNDQSRGLGGIPRREYGETGISLSVIGFGGILVMNESQRDADRWVSEAVERGVNHFDVAPQYGDAEERLGPALEPHRGDVFLACKTLERRRRGADSDLRRSLKRLRTDHLDLYQLHALTSVEDDLDAVFSSGGAMETFIEAKRAGVVRHIGFSAHSAETALAAMERFEFDSILYPVNFATFLQRDEGPRVVKTARSKGMAVLALKSLARQPWSQDTPERERNPKCWYQPITDPREAELALRFTLSQPVTVAIPPGDIEIFRSAMAIAENLEPMTEEETQSIRELALSVTPFLDGV